MKYVLLGLAAFVALAQAATTPAANECMSDTDCADTECCYKKHEFLAVSKKRQNTFEGYPIAHTDLAHTKGMCQSYQQHGESCSPYDSMNGYCSCNKKQGLTCQSIVTKKDLFTPLTRSYKCTPMLMVSKK